MNEIYQIYDKAFKRILTISEKTVINLINGLFDTDYPTNSKITYNWTEHEDKDLKRTVDELNEKDLIALLPFQLLKLRKKIENLRTEENLEEENNYLKDEINSMKNIIHNLQQQLTSLQQ